MSTKKTIFLTGASGNMGFEGFTQLLDRRDRFDIVALVLSTPSERKKMDPYADLPGVRIIWGDLTVYEDVLEGVNNADYVLHVGGMVSPAADAFPEKTLHVNVTAARNIVRAIRSQPDPDAVKLVYIGSVAQTGDRNPPIHWGRTGDPIKLSAFDRYALSKTLAEQAIIDSGLRYWVALRQTGILHPHLLETLDPIMFHEPLNGVLEWVTVRDSGRLLANVCEADVPDAFWRHVYNIGGGPLMRTVNHEFMRQSYAIIGIHDFTKAMDPNWFATRNFHGQWYTDSDVLEDYLHFRHETLDTFFAELKQHLPPRMKLAQFLPPALMRKWVLEPVAQQPLGTLHWIHHDEEARIHAFFGSKAQWKQIPSWKDFPFAHPSRTPSFLDHGYDESKLLTHWNIHDMQQAAAFRGGHCLSSTMEQGAAYTPLQWQCAFEHQFEASAALILLGGHWCRTCMANTDSYPALAERSAFFAQVWNPLQVGADLRDATLSGTYERGLR